MDCLVYSARVPDRAEFVGALIRAGLVYSEEHVQLYHTAAGILKQLAENWKKIGAVVIADGMGDSELIIGACHDVEPPTIPIPVRRFRNGLLEKIEKTP